ncbi:hypothetical protein [Aeromonas veronii]|nr:hypothetical protein [Aeromonas veronii]
MRRADMRFGYVSHDSRGAAWQEPSYLLMEYPVTVISDQGA